VEKLKNRSVAIVLTTCLLGLTGCATNQKNNANDTVNRNFNATSTNNQHGTTILNDTNQKLRLSTRASNSVERMKEVDQAHVIIRNNNAYVAVRLKNNRNGNGTTGIGTTGTNNGTTGTTGTRGYGTNTGTTGNDFNGSNSQMYGNGYNSGATGTTSLDGNKNLAGTTGMGGTGINNTSTTRPGVNGYNNGTTGLGHSGDNGGTAGLASNNNNGTSGMNGTNGTGGNGTSGMGGTNYSKVNSPLEQKIADRVRAADNKIHKVYVSVNPDFFNQMSTYSTNIGNGQNRGLLNDFSTTVRRFFR
jgi:hypothetical protein